MGTDESGSDDMATNDAVLLNKLVHSNAGVYMSADVRIGDRRQPQGLPLYDIGIDWGHM